MPDGPHSVPSSPHLQPELPLRAVAAVWTAILAVALGSLTIFYAQGLTDLYGDALAHMEFARRFFDSLTPGFGTIGSVWLPLFHLLAAPLAINDHLWRTGLAGSIVSIAAFCGTAWILFRLGLEVNGNIAAGVLALAGFLLCPNMLYLASTPMTEALALFWSVLVVYALFRFQMTGQTRWVVCAGVAAFLGTLTRYGEWYVLPFATVFVLLARKDLWPVRFRRTVLFAVLAGAGPLLWVLHCAYSFGNPLQFYNGPYSAQAVYAHQVATTAFRYPTDGSVFLSARYYLADLKLAVGPWSLELAALGLIVWAVDRHLRSRRAAVSLLIVPLPFYVQAMAHAGVGLYVPSLAPYTYYNLRYGLEMLPAVSLLGSFLISYTFPHKLRIAVLTACLLVIGAQGVAMLGGGARELPLVREAALNTPCKASADRALIHFFSLHYDGRPLLMESAEYPCVASTLGIPLHKFLGDTDREYWLQLRSGLPQSTGWIVRGEDGAVDNLMRAYPNAVRGFQPVYRKELPEQKSLTIYRRAAD